MIDWKRIAELKDEVGMEDFEEIVTLFLEEVDGAIAELNADASGPELADSLHFLKGCALNLGFEALGALCQAGERLAHDGRSAEVDVDEVRSVYAASREAFLAGEDSAAA